MTEAERERAAVVAFMRVQAKLWRAIPSGPGDADKITDLTRCLEIDRLASLIERGEHRKGE